MVGREGLRDNGDVVATCSDVGGGSELMPRSWWVAGPLAGMRGQRTETGAGTREGVLSSGLDMAHGGGSWDHPTGPSGWSYFPSK